MGLGGVGAHQGFLIEYPFAEGQIVSAGFGTARVRFSGFGRGQGTNDAPGSVIAQIAVRDRIRQRQIKAVALDRVRLELLNRRTPQAIAGGLADHEEPRHTVFLQAQQGMTGAVHIGDLGLLAEFAGAFTAVGLHGTGPFVRCRRAGLVLG